MTHALISVEELTIISSMWRIFLTSPPMALVFSPVLLDNYLATHLDNAYLLYYIVTFFIFFFKHNWQIENLKYLANSNNDISKLLMM